LTFSLFSDILIPVVASFIVSIFMREHIFMNRQLPAIIVGAGIIGLSTAYALLKQGETRVTVLEQTAVDHERATSHGFSRLLRFEYGSDQLYTQMVRWSLTAWRELERAAHRRLYTPSGVLLLGKTNDYYAQSSYHTVRASGLPVEWLREDECRRRFPQFATNMFNAFSYNPEGGVLHASTCLQTLRDLVLCMGGEIVEGCRVTRLDHDSPHQPVKLFTNMKGASKTLTAGRVVVATGPWVHHLLPDHHLPVRMTRQYLLYFAGLPQAQFEAGRFPAFMADHLYGFPIHQGCNGWVKAASHATGAPVAPDDLSRPDPHVLSSIQEQLYALLPALRVARVARVDSCIYDNSPDEGFILDYLPGDRRIVVATGLSGHGFKFGLLLGSLLASLSRDETPAIPVDRFSLSRFQYAPGRLAHSVA
jgi:monomeric sarcosine oxidase